MKKLMIAAALAAISVSASAAWDDCNKDTYPCAYAYRIKLAGKTVGSKAVYTSTDCDKGTNCWAKAASYRVAGYIWFLGGKGGEGGITACDCACQKDDTWNCHFWDANKKQVFESTSTMTFSVYEILRNSGAQDKAQIAFNLGGLQLAGFGVYNPETKRIKRASGFFAGVLDPAECVARCDKTDVKPAQVFAPCDLTTAVDSVASIAFGRWNLAYKHDKTDALRKGGNVNALYPAAFDGTKIDPSTL